MAKTHEEREYVQQDFEKKADEARTDFMGSLQQAITEFEQEAKKEAVKQAETSVKEAGKREQEDRLKDHLRGFSRTIPSFLMAYGDETVTLETFDQVIPDEVFRDGCATAAATLAPMAKSTPIPACLTPSCSTTP